MNPLEEEKLKDALRQAYRGKDDVAVPEGWTEKVMNHIRILEPIEVRQGFFGQFEQLVWRMAPVVCFLIVVLVLYLLKIDFVPDYKLAERLMSDPMGFVLMETALI